MTAQPHEPRRFTIVSPGQTSEEDLPPEAHLISALLESGTYTPETYGISGDHFLAHRNVHEFARQYQRDAGAAPSLQLVLSKYPRFTYMAGVSPKWAAKQLNNEHRERQLKRAMAKAGQAINAGDIDQAENLFRETLRTTRSATSSGIQSWNAYDILPADHMDRDFVPVLPGTLTQYCRGISSRNLWYLAGIPGSGKSYRLQEHAVIAAEAGWNVDFFSLENPGPEVMERIQKMVACGFDDQPAAAYNSVEWNDWLQSKTSGHGTIRVFNGQMSAADIAAVTQEGNLVVVDHVGKMRSDDGSRSIVDWRVAASISGELKDLAMDCRVPVLAAAQLNKKAYDAKELSLSMLSDTDAYIKDADVIIGMKLMSTTVVHNKIMKNRHEAAGKKFYTRFQPGQARAKEITYDQAKDAEFEDMSNNLS